MKIVTRNTSNHNGTPQVVAKGGGKQRTVQADLSRSNDWNHGTAAGTLALALGWPNSQVSHADNGGTHVFTWL